MYQKKKLQNYLILIMAKYLLLNNLWTKHLTEHKDRGQIRTLLGRLCRFHLWEPNSFGMHKA